MKPSAAPRPSIEDMIEHGIDDRTAAEIDAAIGALPEVDSDYWWYLVRRLAEAFRRNQHESGQTPPGAPPEIPDKTLK